MDLANVSLGETFSLGPHNLFSKTAGLLGNIGVKSPITSFVYGRYSSIALVLFPRGPFFGIVQISIFIPTRARGRPNEKDVINWESGVGVGGILIINGKTCGYYSMRINDKIPHG